MKPEIEDETTQNWLKEAQKGYIRMGVLILINKKPSHGYELMKEINNRTKGFWQPTPGGIYPILRDLEKSSYIKGDWQTQKNRRLKVYKITTSGNAILKRAILKQTEIFDTISTLFHEFARDVLNVEDENIPIPPSPFRPFLEEKTSHQTLVHLEHERKKAVESFKSIRERLRKINEQIEEIKKQTRINSQEPPK